MSHRKKIAGKNRRTLSHEHTIFRDAIFPDACAWTWWEIGGGKKNTTHLKIADKNRRAHDFSRRDVSRCLRADLVLLRGCLTEKIADKNRRTLLHEHTIFRDAIFQ